MKTIALALFMFTQHTDSVLICTGANSHTYHSTTNCHGLVNCHWHTAWVTQAQADSMGRRPCRRCYK